MLPILFQAQKEQIKLTDEQVAGLSIWFKWILYFHFTRHIQDQVASLSLSLSLSINQSIIQIINLPFSQFKFKYQSKTLYTFISLI